MPTDCRPLTDCLLHAYRATYRQIYRRPTGCLSDPRHNPYPHTFSLDSYPHHISISVRIQISQTPSLALFTSSPLNTFFDVQADLLVPCRQRHSRSSFRVSCLGASKQSCLPQFLTGTITMPSMTTSASCRIMSQTCSPSLMPDGVPTVLTHAY
jgi:hypothetical protein